ncbi:5-amino-6-(5-phosphoribosylamino)uracil reductase [Synechococcus sp. Ace-Pa]|nr:5-amino-6-(5-phosphoribosylamino)uracil reductase [Synechococcus sp. Ace-Pa]
MVLAVSLDGRLAPPSGGAAQLGGRGDRQVLEEALAWADGCLIGAGTLRQHGDTCLIHRPQLLEARLGSCRSPQPIAVVVSRQGLLDPCLPFFDQPLERWLLQAGPLRASGVRAGFSRLLRLEAWPESLEALQRLGLERLVLLGGAELASALLAEQLVDELQLTVCPVLLGGPHGWVPWAASIPPQNWDLLEQRPLGEGELLLRYRRVRHQDR